MPVKIVTLWWKVQSGINDNDTIFFFIKLYKVYNVKRPFVVLYKIRYMLVILWNGIEV